MCSIILWKFVEERFIPLRCTEMEFESSNAVPPASVTDLVGRIEDFLRIMRSIVLGSRSIVITMEKERKDKFHQNGGFVSLFSKPINCKRDAIVNRLDDWTRASGKDRHRSLDGISLAITLRLVDAFFTWAPMITSPIYYRIVIAFSSWQNRRILAAKDLEIVHSRHLYCYMQRSRIPKRLEF